MANASPDPLEHHDDYQVANQVARNTSRNSQEDRIRRYLSLGIPVLIVAIVASYVLVWSVSNSNPTLRASPADQRVVQRITGMSQSSWQRIGTGGLSNPWRTISGQPVLNGPYGHPEFFFVGAEFCEFCATERWTILNALSRFGSFSHLSQLRSYDDQLATFSFNRSTYASPYVDFVPVERVGNTKDILGQFVPLQPFQGNQQQVFNRYASTTYLPNGQGFPFIDLNNQYLLGGGLDPTVLQNAAHEPLSWREIADALTIPSSPVAQQILGTANFLTAAICLVTSQQPGSVCQAAVIQQIESALRTLSSAMNTTRHMCVPPGLLASLRHAPAASGRGAALLAEGSKAERSAVQVRRGSRPCIVQRGRLPAVG
jgi:hypothetical protein